MGNRRQKEKQDIWMSSPINKNSRKKIQKKGIGCNYLKQTGIM